MTPRERVHTAFRHEEVDRTPFFERMIKPPSDSAILGRPAVHEPNWHEYMRVWSRDGWDVLMERVAQDEFEIACRLGFDMICLHSNPSQSFLTPVEIDPYTFRQGDTVCRYHPESGVVENLTSRARSAEEWERQFRMAIERDFVSVTIPDDELIVFRRVKELMASAKLDLAIYVSLYAIPVAALPVFAIEWFISEPELIDRYYERLTLQAIETGCRYIREGADVLGLGGDFAGDTGPVISPKAYRHHVVPCLRRQSDALHSAAGRDIWTTNTSDGYLWDVMDDFLHRAGVDGYGEIDVAAGMDLARLKHEWGDRYTFLGNLDIRHVLCSGTVQQARAEMVRCVEQGWGNGGHVIMTSNVVHEDVRPELYREAVCAYRDYFGLPLCV